MRGKCLKVEKEGELVKKKKKKGRLERGFRRCREKRERGSDERGLARDKREEND